MRRTMVGLLGLSAAALLSLEACSGARPAANLDVQHVSAEQDKDEKDKKHSDPFELPRDKGGQLLGQVLPPRARQGTLNRQDRPAPPTVPAPTFVEPAPSLPAGTALVSRVPTPPRKGELRPRLVNEESFEGAVDEPVLPRAPTFVTEKPTRVPSEDASIPPPPPILAQPTLDRVSADDFTMEASTEAALSATLPVRTSPAPFVKGGVPEPFENRKPLTTKLPDEETVPVADGPSVPK